MIYTEEGVMSQRCRDLDVKHVHIFITESGQVTKARQVWTMCCEGNISRTHNWCNMSAHKVWAPVGNKIYLTTQVWFNENLLPLRPNRLSTQATPDVDMKFLYLEPVVKLSLLMQTWWQGRCLMRKICSAMLISAISWLKIWQFNDEYLYTDSE